MEVIYSLNFEMFSLCQRRVFVLVLLKKGSLYFTWREMGFMNPRSTSGKVWERVASSLPWERCFPKFSTGRKAGANPHKISTVLLNGLSVVDGCLR